MNDTTVFQEVGETEDAEYMANVTASEWFLSRPPEIQVAVRSHPAWRRFRMKSTGHICAGIHSYSEPVGEGQPVTATVVIYAADNAPSLHDLMGMGNRQVFGVALANLETLPFRVTPLETP